MPDDKPRPMISAGINWKDPSLATSLAPLITGWSFLIVRHISTSSWCWRARTLVSRQCRRERRRWKKPQISSNGPEEPGLRTSRDKKRASMLEIFLAGYSLYRIPCLMVSEAGDISTSLRRLRGYPRTVPIVSFVSPLFLVAGNKSFSFFVFGHQ